MKLLTHILWLMAVALAAASCASEEPAPPGGEDGDGQVRLVLRVGINNSPSQEKTRAAGEYPDGYPYDFEPASTVYEGIHSLRVIIVRPDNTVEHNRITYFSDRIPEPDDVYGELEFGVKGGEMKRTYLIANEASVTPVVDFTAWVPGSTLDEKTALGWQIYRPWGGKTAEPYIDNEGDAGSYVPMSEYFDIYIEPAGNEDRVHKETLFITRSLVKFSFHVKSESPVSDSFRISRIEFENVMQKGFLIPNDTEYSPSKSLLNENFRRIITRFTTPGFSDNQVLPIVFTPSSFGLNARDGNTAYSDSYVPELYYCETQNNTAGNTFSIRCEVTGEDGESYMTDTVRLPNLPSFPRNTHVKVVFTFVDRSLTCKVILMPYIGVWLNPIFGLDPKTD